MRRTFLLLMALHAPTALAANTPPPAPTKLAQNFGFTCLMLAEREAPTPLSINIRYEPLTAENSFFRKAYWWTLSGPSERFPSNETFMNMRSLELELPQSGMGFTAADGWSYSYALYYAVEERFPEFVYVPDHLVVRRKRAGETDSAWQLVGMGECRLDTAPAPVR